ncbi:hypothetical protein IV203_032260 [Nitzschia inconspicua]|uniref:Uncharacterized protein n=1 Tax=Nitzschia inconspicua TaxID=303405 RepID=A0A9K3PH45_9STRA|nr:hypothetical protein IV203_032260 [Nitzschia inconspicua]
MATTPPSKHCCYRDVPSFSMGERSNLDNQEPRPSPVYVARDWPERSPFASPIRTMMDVDHGGSGGNPDGTDDLDGDNAMMLKHHQALFSSSFDTISDAGQPLPQPLTHPRHHFNNGDSNNNSFFDTTVSLLDQNMMMLESPMAQKPDGRRNSMVIQPRSQYQDLLVEESGSLQRNSESREEEQQDGRLMMEHDTDETHRSSSDDDNDEKPIARTSNRKNNNLYSPPPKVVHRKDPHPAAPDISPIALDVFQSHAGKRQAQQTRDGTATQMLRHATSPGSIDQQPNEVSYLKSESSSTGAEDLDKSYDTTQSTAANKRSNHASGEQGNYKPNSHSYPPHYETNGPDVAPNYHRNDRHHLYHPLPQPNASKYHPKNAIQSSPVIARRRHGPPMLPYWGQYPYQRSNAGHLNDAQQHYPPSYHLNDAQQHYPPSYYYQHASHYDQNRHHTITESNRNHPPYPPTALTAPSSHHHPSTSSSSSILQHAEYYPNNPIYILRSVRKAFKGCTYLLHCVQSSQSVCPVTIHQAHMGIVEYHDHQLVDPTPEDLTIAIRRVESAIYAFGGYVHTSSSSGSDSGGKNAKKSKTSIFRRLSTRQGTSLQSSNETYHGKFHQRYCIKGHGISWEIEENPPIEISDETTHSNGKKSGQRKRTHTSKANLDAWNGENGLEASMEASFDDDEQAPASPCSTSPSHDGDDTLMADTNKKMKYRCKLCGKPKQNHSCPYRSSLQRSIGVSVVPVVNGYTAEEPGVLTVALSEMNNFVSYVGSSMETTALEVQDENDDDDGDDDDATSQRSARRRKVPPPVQVTLLVDGPNKNKNMVQDSPQNSSLSSVPTPGRRPTPSSLRRVARKRTLHSTCQERRQKRPTNTFATAAATTTTSTTMTTTTTRITPTRPRLFAEPLLLRPEHYRAVSHSKKGRGGVGMVNGILLDDPNAFEYVPIPVSFQGRKRLSDTLFYLSKSLPSITAEVATLLRTAREGDEWDLAVAQLLTQVIVALYCVEGDHQLDGLRRYLLNIGIAT